MSTLSEALPYRCQMTRPTTGAGLWRRPSSPPCGWPGPIIPGPSPQTWLCAKRFYSALLILATWAGLFIAGDLPAPRGFSTAWIREPKSCPLLITSFDCPFFADTTKPRKKLVVCRLYRRGDKSILALLPGRLVSASHIGSRDSCTDDYSQQEGS